MEKYNENKLFKKVKKKFISLQILFIYLLLERGEGRQKERERNINAWLPLVCPPLRTWPTIQACVLTGNRTGDSLARRPMLNPRSYTSQDRSLYLNSYLYLRSTMNSYFIVKLFSQVYVLFFQHYLLKRTLLPTELSFPTDLHRPLWRSY